MKTTFFDAVAKARSFNDIKASPELPAGAYELMITKVDADAVLKFDFGDHPEGTPCVEIYFRPVAALDVDEDALAECENWKSKVVSLRLLDADDALRLFDAKNNRGLLVDAGLSASDYERDDGIDLEGVFKDLKGRSVWGMIVHVPNKKNPDKPYVQLKKTAALG